MGCPRPAHFPPVPYAGLGGGLVSGAHLGSCVWGHVCVCLHARCGGDREKTLTSVNATAAVSEGVICYHSPPLKHTISKHA